MVCALLCALESNCSEQNMSRNAECKFLFKAPVARGGRGRNASGVSSTIGKLTEIMQKIDVRKRAQLGL